MPTTSMSFDPVAALLIGILFAALFGLTIGSYLNVVVYRLPRDLSTVRPASRCPACATPIRWRDNIPLLSWLLLRGRCRDCGESISGRYPAVEAATSVLFVLSVWRFGATPDAVVACALCALLLALALIDAEHYLLPDRLTFPGMAIGLAGSFVVTWTGPLSAVLAMIVGALLLLLLIGAWYLARRELGMGFGDPKMLAMVGAFLGLPKMVLTLLLASILGSVISLVLLASKRAGLGSKLPFGVFLALGALLSLFFGDGLVHWYLGLAS